MVYVNTLRDLDVMVRTAKHFDSRVTEAVRYGVLAETAAQHVRSSPASSQRFLGSYLRRVNGGLHRWLEHCMPHRFAHISLQRLVVRGSHGQHSVISDAHSDSHVEGSTRCFNAVVRPLLRVLRLPPDEFNLNATRSFLTRSLSTVQKSLAEANHHPLRVHGDDEAVSWPAPLEASACRGPLQRASKRERRVKL